MKRYTDQLEEMEKELSLTLSSAIHDLLSVKFSKKISEMTKFQIKHIIQDKIDTIVWMDEIKNNLKGWIFDYTQELNEQKKQLNIRMEFLEQRHLDFMRKVQEGYYKF